MAMTRRRSNPRCRVRVGEAEMVTMYGPQSCEDDSGSLVCENGVAANGFWALVTFHRAAGSSITRSLCSAAFREVGTLQNLLLPKRAAGPSTASSLCDDFAQDDILCFER